MFGDNKFNRTRKAKAIEIEIEIENRSSASTEIVSFLKSGSGVAG